MLIDRYGQTGSGKSFTMVRRRARSSCTNYQTGIPEELGVIPCAVDGVFDAINEVRRSSASADRCRNRTAHICFGSRTSKSTTRHYATCSISRKARFEMTRSLQYTLERLVTPHARLMTGESLRRPACREGRLDASGRGRSLGKGQHHAQSRSDRLGTCTASLF